ncbi:MAG: usg protein [Hyphomicrobiales bacterium]|nr:usg protein [Hyphomicrobiales bacterium]
MVDPDFRKQLEGYSLTTAEILYRMPDHLHLLQSFIWQEFDLAPRFPRLESFLSFWESNLDGPLYRVTVSHKKLVSPTEYEFADGVFAIN